MGNESTTCTNNLNIFANYDGGAPKPPEAGGPDGGPDPPRPRPIPYPPR